MSSPVRPLRPEALASNQRALEIQTIEELGLNFAVATFASSEHPVGNEDHYFAHENTFGVFDGQSEQEEGQHASQLAGRTIETILNSALPKTVREAEQLMVAAFAAADAALSKETPRGQSAASALLFWQSGSGLFVTLGNLGSSEIYLKRESSLHLLGYDRETQSALGKGDLSKQGLMPSIASFQLQDGDQVAILTKGVSGPLTTAMVAETWQQEVHPAQMLVVRAQNDAPKERANIDDRTALIIDIPIDYERRERIAQREIDMKLITEYTQSRLEQLAAQWLELYDTYPTVTETNELFERIKINFERMRQAFAGDDTNIDQRDEALKSIDGVLNRLNEHHTQLDILGNEPPIKATIDSDKRDHLASPRAVVRVLWPASHIRQALQIAMHAPQPWDIYKVFSQALNLDINDFVTLTGTPHGYPKEALINDGHRVLAPWVTADAINWIRKHKDETYWLSRVPNCEEILADGQTLEAHAKARGKFSNITHSLTSLKLELGDLAHDMYGRAPSHAEIAAEPMVQPQYYDRHGNPRPLTTLEEIASAYISAQPDGPISWATEDGRDYGTAYTRILYRYNKHSGIVSFVVRQYVTEGGIHHYLEFSDSLNDANKLSFKTETAVSIDATGRARRVGVDKNFNRMPALRARQQRTYKALLATCGPTKLDALRLHYRSKQRKLGNVVTRPEFKAE